VVQAGALTWFYDGPGGNFEYWPEGLNGRMFSERPPFGNVAIMADNDQMCHRIGRVGEPDARLPRMTSVAEIGRVDEAWEIVENGETRATYPSTTIRLSLVWKAIRESDADSELLTLNRVMSVFIADLRRRSIDFRIPGDPLSDNEWVALLDRVYYAHPVSENAK